jgi:hypothetical protein
MAMTERMKAAQAYSERAPKSICTCSHTGDGANSEHAGLIARGHGMCMVAGCKCPKFSWARSTPEFVAFMEEVSR